MNISKISVKDSVRVKKGISDPDFPSIDISGYEGRVVSVFEDEGSKMVEIHWDSVTLLKQMSLDNIIASDAEGYDFTTMNLDLEDVEKSTPRDTPKDVEKAIEHLYEQLPEAEEDEEANERVLEIIGGEELDVTEKALAKYLIFLKKSIKAGTMLTGVEPFEWEEKYFESRALAKEYAQKKKAHPSFEDTFELVSFLYDKNQHDEIHVKVKRDTDKKVFELQLCDLQVEDEESNEAELIDDYSYWILTFA
jgi:NADH:ubiquinone oxidoreductase subunit C